MENRITFNKSILPNQDKVATMCRYKTKKPFQVISQFQIEKENSKFWVWVSVTSSRRSHIGIINLGLTGLEETRRILLSSHSYSLHNTLYCYTPAFQRGNGGKSSSSFRRYEDFNEILHVGKLLKTVHQQYQQPNTVVAI